MGGIAGVTWPSIVLSIAYEACLPLDSIVKLALVVNRFNRYLKPAPRLLDDSHYEITWRGFWSSKVENILKTLMRRGHLQRLDGCLRARASNSGPHIPEHVLARAAGVVGELGMLTSYELDREIARMFSSYLGVPVIIEHIVGARVTDLAPLWPPRDGLKLASIELEG